MNSPVWKNVLRCMIGYDKVGWGRYDKVGWGRYIKVGWLNNAVLFSMTLQPPTGGAYALVRGGSSTSNIIKPTITGV